MKQHLNVNLESVYNVKASSGLVKDGNTWSLSDKVSSNMIPVFIDIESPDYKDEYELDDEPYYRTAIARESSSDSFLEFIFQYWNKYLSQSKRILDIACGNGYVLNAIVTRYPDIEAYGIDKSLAVTAHQHKNRQISYCVADIFEHPYKKSSFDLVINSNFIEHLDSPGLLIKIMADLLTDKGVLALATPNRFRVSNLVRLASGKDVALMNERHHVTEYSLGQIKEMMWWHRLNALAVSCSPASVADLTRKSRRKYRLMNPFLKLYELVFRKSMLLGNTQYGMFQKA